MINLRPVDPLAKLSAAQLISTGRSTTTPAMRPANIIYVVFFSDRSLNVVELKIDLISTIIRSITMPVFRVIMPAAERNITISL